MSQIFIGIDLAWGDKNPSGFCALVLQNNKLQLQEIKLLQTLDEIIKHIEKYSHEEIFVGIDAPLIIPNESGNREIEKEFNRDFSKYKIAMLPVNRKLLTKYSPTIRSELLYQELSKIGFKRDFSTNKVIFEVYPHATIAVCFNKYKILPYKRKKGRDTAFIKEQLKIYTHYLSEVIEKNDFFDEDIDLLKGKSLKDYEDQLDAITSAYTLYYCKYNRSKFYKLNSADTFVTPI